uniref:Uncharacterized protein n=1 Tax=Anguilla anguilla TaxID=7936 RepID=A0A0E9UUU4_ANGAN
MSLFFGYTQKANLIRGCCSCWMLCLFKTITFLAQYQTT